MYQFGGIYLDTDSHSIKRFPKILQKSFVSYIFSGWNNIQNSVFGFSKHSRFLKFVIESLKLNWKKPGYRNQSVPWKTGPTFLTSMLVSCEAQARIGTGWPSRQKASKLLKPCLELTLKLVATFPPPTHKFNFTQIMATWGSGGVSGGKGRCVG